MTDMENSRLVLDLIPPADQMDSYWLDESQRDRTLEDDYIIGNVIGRGASSVVYKCLYKGKTECACKVFKKVSGHLRKDCGAVAEHKPKHSPADPGSKEALNVFTQTRLHKQARLNRKMVQTEVSILLKLKHPNIIQLRDVFETKSEVQMVLELVTGGELFERVVERGHYSEEDAAAAVRQILAALQYLHSQGVVHRDLKPENLLYETDAENARLKLADFGLSKMLQEGRLTMTTLCGTVGYCAPEILLNKEYDSSVDIWSLGVVTYIMLCGFEPFWDEAGEIGVCRKIVDGAYDFPSPWWDDISISAKCLITQLLHVNPAKRPTAAEILTHPWVRGETAKQEHMMHTVKKLREFNAKRKFRAATHVVLATQRAKYLISPENKPKKSPTQSI